jgi:hypothetical protein
MKQIDHWPEPTRIQFGLYSKSGLLWDWELTIRVCGVMGYRGYTAGRLETWEVWEAVKWDLEEGHARGY